MIHPPLDAGLWLGLARRFPDRPDILERTNCVNRIKEIVDYECYRRIIDGCRVAAKALECELIEVEQTVGRDRVRGISITAADPSTASISIGIRGSCDDRGSSIASR